MEKLRKELIDFCNYIESEADTKWFEHSSELVDPFLKSRNSAQDESPSVQHNEDQRKPCNCIWQCDSPPVDHLDRCKQYCQGQQGG